MDKGFIEELMKKTGLSQADGEKVGEVMESNNLLSGNIGDIILNPGGDSTTDGTDATDGSDGTDGTARPYSDKYSYEISRDGYQHRLDEELQ